MTDFLTYSGKSEADKEKKYHILLHGDRPLWLKLNDSAIEIAERLDKGESADKIAAQLAAEIGISHDTVKQDVLYVRNLLTEKGFLTDEKSSSMTRKPCISSLYLHLTDRCNLSCRQCYVAGKKVKKELPLPAVLRMIDELAENKGADITLSGGEPLLYSEIRSVIRHIPADIKIKILTNGTLIDQEWAAFFADKNVSLQISIDGSKPEIHDAIRGKGNFEKAMRAVQYLQDAGMEKRLNFSATIMRQNLHDLPEIIRLAEKVGVPRVRFLPLRRTGRAEEYWNNINPEGWVKQSGSRPSEEKEVTGEYENFFRYVKELQKNRQCRIDISCGLSGFLLFIPESVSNDDIWCPVGKMLVIDTDGSAYPCALLRGEEFRLGNAFSESLTQLVHSEKMAEVCHALSARKEKIGKCSSCLWKNFCQAGCMGQASEHRGTVWDTDDFCEYRKKAYQEVFDMFLR